MQFCNFKLNYHFLRNKIINISQISPLNTIEYTYNLVNLLIMIFLFIHLYISLQEYTSDTSFPNFTLNNVTISYYHSSKKLGLCFDNKLSHKNHNDPLQINQLSSIQNLQKYGHNFHEILLRY